MRRPAKPTPSENGYQILTVSPLLACLILLALPAPGLATPGSDAFDGVRAKYGAMVRAVAEEVVGRHQRLGALLESCGCSYDPCGADFDLPEVACLDARTPEAVNCASGDLCGHLKLAPNHTSIRTPRGVASQGGLDPLVVKDICLTQGLETTFKEATNFNGKFTPWLYFAVVRTGVMRSWPLKAGNKNTNGECEPYDPRQRPWYKVASSEPKKVVIIVQASETMSFPMHLGAGDNGKSRWDVAVDAVEALLASFCSINDFVNIVAFNVRAAALGGETLVQTNNDNGGGLMAALRSMELVPGADNKVGFDAAFDLLEETSERSGCQNIIIHIGDGDDCTARPQPGCSLTQNSTEGARLPNGVLKNLEAVEARQRALELTSGRAAIFPVTVQGGDDSLARQVACRNGGTWSVLNGRGEPLNNMATFFQYLAFSMEAHASVQDVKFSPVYSDHGGLGDMTTLVCPVFVNPGCGSGMASDERLLLGVVGKDVTMKMLEEDGLSREQVETMIDENLGKARVCSQHYQYSNCRMQGLRNSGLQGTQRGECPSRRWNISDLEKCYAFEGKAYLLVAEPVDFLAAQERCGELGGRLVELGPEESPEEQHFLASIVPPDGAWIGLQPMGRTWQWVGSMRQAQGDQLWFTEPLKNTVCRGGFVDPRGTERNIGARKCQEKTAFVCEFNSTMRDLPPACQGNATVSPEELRAFTDAGCVGSDPCTATTANLQIPEPLRNKVICRADERVTKQYNELVCCTPQELPEFCLTKEDSAVNASSALVETDAPASGSSSQITALGAAIAIVGAIFLGLTALLAAEAKSPGTFQRAYEGLAQRLRGSTSIDVEGGRTPTPQGGEPEEDNYITFVPSNVNRTLSTIPSVSETSFSSSGSAAPRYHPCPDPTTTNRPRSGAAAKAVEYGARGPARAVRPARNVQEAEAQLQSPFEVESNRPKDSVFPYLVASPPVRWARPIQGIQNVTTIEGGWEVGNADGSIKEGVWVDSDRRAHKVATKRRREWSNEGCLAALRREVEAMADVPYHPNIAWLVGVHLGEDPFVVEELMPKSLHQVLHDNAPPLMYFDILRVCLGVAKGISHLHKHGITHYDIKPSNILLDKDNQSIKLADCIASRLKWTATITPSTHGSLGYCAPELLVEGVQPCQPTAQGPQACMPAHPADVYSLGKVMLVCVTGGLDSIHPQAEAACPPGLWGLIRQCGEEDPRGRPIGEEIVQILDDMLCERPLESDWRMRKPKEEIWQG